MISEPTLSYDKLIAIYNKYFSLGNLNCDFKNKMALISMICHLVYQLKQKKPDVTYYKLIQKLAEGKGLPDNFIMALAINCEEFGYNCKEFITFGLKDKEMIDKIRKIFDTYLPF